MNLLVAGAAVVDAGKTTFSTGLVRRTGAVGFKPRAGNDYWYDHDDYRRAVEAGHLYGKDARRLAAASAADVGPEEVNPVHRLWRPTPGPGTGLLGREDREFLLDRVGDSYVLNGGADLPASAREHLPLADAAVVGSIEELNAVMEKRHVPAIRRLTGAIEAARSAVVESYGDVAVPVATVTFDAVAVVEPGRARIYDGDRFAKAHTVAGGGAGRPRQGQLEETVDDLLDLLEPAETVGLPALTKDRREDPAAVADAYEPAYDAMLAVAEQS